MSQFELLWIRVQTQSRTMFVGALYHPPNPLYQSTALLDHIEAGVDALATAYPAATVVLAAIGSNLYAEDRVEYFSVFLVAAQEMCQWHRGTMTGCRPVGEGCSPPKPERQELRAMTPFAPPGRRVQLALLL